MDTELSENLTKKKSNVIVFPTWFGGTSEHLSNLIGPGKFVDASKYFVIAIDAFGNGVSSSPSNSELQPGSEFPEFNIRDMVHAQYRFITEKLDLHHVYGFVGGSMGSMQVFEWVVTYPDFMDKALPYVCSPARTSYDLLLINTQLNIIDTYRSLGADDKTIYKTLDMYRAIFARSPDYIAEKIPREEFYEYLKKFDKEKKTIFTVDNFRSQAVAMIEHNIYASFDNSMEKAAERIKADMLIMVSSSDHIVHPKSALEFAKLINAEVVILDGNNGHLAVGAELKKCTKIVHNFFE